MLVMAIVAMVLAGCSAQMPRAWREAVRGPDPTSTPRLTPLPSSTPRPPTSLPTPAAPPTALPTITPGPTRTPTVTLTPTATPAQARLILQEGAQWYVGDRFQPYEGTSDTYISAWSRSSAFAGATSLSIRQGDIMAALIRFDLSDLPPSLVVERAELSVHIAARSNQTPMTLTVSALLQPWLSAEATWLQASNSTSWNEAGALGAGDRAAEPAAVAVAAAPGVWLSFDVTDLARTWLKDGEQNDGVIISGEAGNAVQYDITSADARDERFRPRLTLTLPTGAVALGPALPPTPTRSPTPALDPFGTETANLARLLPIGSAVLARAAGDLTGADAPDIVAAYRSGPERGVSVAVFTRGGSDYRLLWNSQDVPGAAPVSLDIVDMTGDGVPEILLSVAGASGNGRSLYVYTSRPSGYRLALPIGGSFDGQSAFGAGGYEVKDIDGDGKVEIVAQRAAGSETYAWDGLHFSLRK